MPAVKTLPLDEVTEGECVPSIPDDDWSGSGGGGTMLLALLVAGGVFTGQARAEGKTRTYYIAADEVAWSYAPQGHNLIASLSARPGTPSSRPDRFGSTYTKCLYQGYRDASFTRQLQRPRDEQYLGLLGPVIRAEVGDTIKVVFRNNCSFPASIHPHGVFYDKSNEGALYNDGTLDRAKTDDSAAPGQEHTYTWKVPERADPGPMEGRSVIWM
jgi:FtsP/CotA-like multicopper oxidase with cupredoxin domain